MFKTKNFHVRTKARGVIEIKVIGKDGKIKLRRIIRNTVTSAGKNAICALVVGVRTTPFTYVAIGTGSPSDTGLGDEVARTKATVSAPSYAQWTASFTASSAMNVTEAGIFDSSSGGTMLAYQSFSAIPLSAGDVLQITWTLSVS